MFACDMLVVLCYHFLYCFYYYVIILVSYRCVLESIMGNTNNKAVCETKEAVQSFLKYARKKAKAKKRKLNEQKDSYDKSWDEYQSKTKSD